MACIKCGTTSHINGFGFCPKCMYENNHLALQQISTYGHTGPCAPGCQCAFAKAGAASRLAGESAAKQIFTSIPDTKVDAAPVKDGGGLRFNDGKPRMDLLSPIALLGVAKVLEVGANKYAEHNWRRGMAWSKAIASLMRHMVKFMAGEDLDSETGLPHIDHVACNAMFLQEYFREHKKLDDRFKVSVEDEKK